MVANAAGARMEGRFDTSRKSVIRPREGAGDVLHSGCKNSLKSRLLPSPRKGAAGRDSEENLKYVKEHTPGLFNRDCGNCPRHRRTGGGTIACFLAFGGRGRRSWQ